MISVNQKNYTLEIIEDFDSISPRENDNIGEMICFHSRYNLGDTNTFSSKEDFFQSLLTDILGDEELAEQKIETTENQFDIGKYGQHYQKYEKEIDQLIISEIEKEYIILPLYLYDHSGITISTEPFSCPWDSGQVGWIYASKEDVVGALSLETLNENSVKKITEILKHEVVEYDNYIQGNCYGFNLYQNEENIDSVWGFIGELADVVKDVEYYLPTECKGMTKLFFEEKNLA